MSNVLAQMFANQHKDQWQCTTCLAYSPESSNACLACEVARPGHAEPRESGNLQDAAATFSFSFSAPTQSQAEAPAPKPTKAFSFDTSSSPAAVNGSSTFSFTTDESTRTAFNFDTAPGKQGATTFSFDTTPAELPSATTFSFGDTPPVRNPTDSPLTPDTRSNCAKTLVTTPAVPDSLYEEPAENVAAQPPPPATLSGSSSRKRSRQEAGLPTVEADGTWKAYTSSLFDGPIPNNSDGSQASRNASDIEMLKRQLLDLQRQLRNKDERISQFSTRVQELEQQIEYLRGEILAARPTKRRRINVEQLDMPIRDTTDTGSLASTIRDKSAASSREAGGTKTVQDQLWNGMNKWHTGAKRSREDSRGTAVRTLSGARTSSAPAGKISRKTSFIPMSVVLTCGLGEQGELGRGDDEPELDMMSKQFMPVNLPFDPTRPDTKILRVCAGSMTSAILAEVNGRKVLTTWGGEDCGMGRGYNPTIDEFSPGEVPLPEGCVPREIGVGNTLLAVCSESGRLYLSGGFTNSNNKKSFGTVTNTNSSKKYKLTHIPTPDPIEHVAAGSEFVVCSSGRDIYVLGYDPTYQFPEADKMMENPNDPSGPMMKMPENIQIVETEQRCYRGTADKPRFTVDFDIDHIAAGQDTLAILSSSGQLYMAGMNDHSQCGSPKLPWDEVLQMPTLVQSGALLGKKIMDVETGHYTIALTARGEVITFGRNTDGQLGHGTQVVETTRNPPIHTPKVVKLPAGAKARSIGRGLLHAFAIGSGGQLYAWGLNNVADDCSTLGLKDVSASHVIQPTRVPGIVASLIDGGDKHAVCVGVSESDDLITPAAKRSRVNMEFAT